MTIKLNEFRAGDYRKSYQYSYFMPSYINENWQWTDPSINSLLEKAAVKLGELNSFAKLVPNIDLFIQLHVTKEAVVSSRIEGTQTHIDEALLPEEEVNPERHHDWKEVNNYVHALNNAIDHLKKLPISSRLIKQTHELLLDSVRGEHKMPGEYRLSQNWIGGASLNDATFIPPHQDYVNDLMTDLEKFLHNEELSLPDLVKIGIAHYQFETIHPFLDGNGRIGRLLITLYMISANLLEKPLLYLSAFFEKDKHLYYDNLTRVRTHNEIEQWIKYFLVGVEQTASDGVSTLTKILGLKEEIESIIQNKLGRRAPNGYRLVQHLFQDPFINVEKASEVCEINYRPANDLISKLQELGIIKEITGQSRNRLFVFEPYIKIFRQ